MSAIAINPIHRAVRFYEAPIGKKAVMAVTGVILFGYVVAHLLGNLQIYSRGPATRSTATPPSCTIRQRRAAVGRARASCWLAVVLHIVASVQLWKLKRDARPVAYVKKDDVPPSYAARTMMWSGPIVAAFVIFHVLHLTVGAVVPLQRDRRRTQPDVRANVIAGFQNPAVSGFYILAMILLVHAPVSRAVEHVPVAGLQPSPLHADAEERRGHLRHPDRHRQLLHSDRGDGRPA